MSRDHPPTTGAQQRRATAAALREQQRRRELRRHRVVVLLSVLAGVLVVAAVVTAVVLARSGSGSPGEAAAAEVLPTTPTGETTVAQPAPRVTDTSGIDGVLAWATGDWPGAGTSTAAGMLEHDHVPGPVTYDVVPPVGGPHSAVWMNAGVYTRPVPAERAVHDLEHGAVWITYRPDLPADQVRQLRDFVSAQSLVDESAGTRVAGQANRYVDLSPWGDDALPSAVVISAWGHQLRLDGPGDPRMQQFVDTFRCSQRYSPEYGAVVDGQPVDVGGRAAADGSTEPNPATGGAASM